MSRRSNLVPQLSFNLLWFD